MKITYSSTAQKKLSRLPKKEKIKVIRNIRKISLDPYSGKKLKGQLRGIWSFRAWPYRIIYRTLGKKLQIITIEHRQKVYK